jgi:hypothetical protein
MHRIPIRFMSVSLAASLTACTATPPHSPSPATAALTPACTAGTMAWIGGTAYADLQSALDATQPDDTINVCPGRWTFASTLEHSAGHSFSLVGATTNPLDTVLVASHTDSMMAISRQRGVVSISNLSIESSAGVGIGGESFEQLGSSVVVDNVVTNSTFVLLLFFDCNIENTIIEGSSVSMNCINHTTNGCLFDQSNIYLNTGYPITGDVSINIHNTSFYNYEDPGAGSVLTIHPSRRVHHRISIRDSQFFNNHSMAQWPDGPGGGPTVAIWGSVYEGAPPVDVVIEDSTFDNNSGHTASHLWLFNLWGESEFNARIARTNFWRGAWPAATGPVDYWLSRSTDIGSAVRADGGDFGVNMTFEDVDFGLGENENLGMPIANCTTRYRGMFDADIRVHRDTSALVRCP